MAGTSNYHAFLRVGYDCDMKSNMAIPHILWVHEQGLTSIETIHTLGLEVLV